MIHLRPPSCLRYERGRDERGGVGHHQGRGAGPATGRSRLVHVRLGELGIRHEHRDGHPARLLRGPVQGRLRAGDHVPGIHVHGQLNVEPWSGCVGGYRGTQQPDPGDDRRQVADQEDDAADLHDRRRDLHGAGVLQRLHRRAVGVGPRLLCDREHRVRGRHRLLQLDAATPGGTGRAGQDQQPRVRVRVRGRRAAAGGPPCGYPGVLRHRPSGPRHEACGRVSGSMVAGLGAVDLQDGARAEGRQAGRPARPDDGGVGGIFPGAPDLKGAQALADARPVPRCIPAVQRRHPDGADDRGGVRAGHAGHLAGVEHGDGADRAVCRGRRRGDVRQGGGRARHQGGADDCAGRLVLRNRGRGGVRPAGAGGARGLRLPAGAHGRRRV